MLKTFKIEWFKLRHSKLLLIATFLPLMAVFQGRLLVVNISNSGKAVDIWQLLYIGSVSQFSSLIFPITITVVMAMITKIEHSNNGWKQILAMPLKREHIYFSKLIIGMLIAIYSTIVFCLGVIILGKLMGASANIPYEIIIQRPLLAIIASLPIISIQFYLSFQFSHIGVPLAFGAAAALPSMLVANSAKYWILYPWTYPIITTLTETFGFGNKGIIMYVICFVLFVSIISLGLVRFLKKDII